MNSNSLLIAAVLITVCTALVEPAGVQHQSDLHGDNNGKNHLCGIRPLRWQPRYLSRDERFVAVNDASDELLYSRRGGRALTAPTAIAPPKVLDDFVEAVDTTTARSFTVSSSIASTVFMASTIAAGDHHKSKWDKIGPLIDARGSSFQRMRLVQQNRPTPTPAHIPMTTTATYRMPTVVHAEPQRSLQHIATVSATSTMDQAKKSADLLDQRRYRPRIRGQILTAVAEPITEPAEAPPAAKTIGIASQPVSGGTTQLQTSEPEDHYEDHDEPIIHENYVPPAPPRFRAAGADDYHHRKGHVATEKRFKLAPGKVGYRPRLKIRRPSDTVANAAVAATAAARAAADGSLSGVAPIRLPNLAPLHDDDSDAAPAIPRSYASSSGFDTPARQFSRKMFIIEEPIPSNADREVIVPVHNFGSNVAVVASASNAAVRAAAAPTFVGPPKDDSDPPNWDGKDAPALAFTEVPPPPPEASTAATSAATIFSGGEERGSIGEQPPQPTGLQSGAQPQSPPSPKDSGLAFEETMGQLPPGQRPEQFKMSSSVNFLHQETPHNTPVTATSSTFLPSNAAPIPPPRPAVAVHEELVVPENSGLRPVAPPKELSGLGFGSSGSRSFSGGGFGGGGVLPPPQPSPARPPAFNAQVEPPKDDDFFTGDSALTPNQRGPTGDGYGPPVVEGAAVPPLAPPGPVSYGGAAAGILPEETALLPVMRPPSAPHSSADNSATTVRPSALLNILNRADEGFNQVISHFEQGTPIEAAAIDVLEVALGSQKLDSQAKLLSHVDRTIGLDNIQRLQRWANTGGALDMIKEQFAKMAKNYKPPPETRAITIPPQFEYLFQSG